MNNYIYSVTIIITILLITILSLSSSLYSEEITYGDYLLQLVNIIGVKYTFSSQPSTNDYLNLATKANINLPKNWNPEAPISKNEKAALLTQVLTIKGEKSQCFWNKDITYKNQVIVKQITGKVMVKRDRTNTWIPAAINMKISGKDTIKTYQNSHVLLEDNYNHKLKIWENRELTLNELEPSKHNKERNIIINLATINNLNKFNV